MSLNNLKIATKLRWAFVVVVATFALSSAVIYSSIKRTEQSASVSASSLAVSAHAEHLLTLILEETNALRGYVIKGDPKFAATYRESTAAFDKEIAWVGDHAPGADQQAQVAAMREAMATWRATIGDKVIALMAQPAGQAEAANLSGVKSLTQLRTVQKAIRDAADKAAADAGRDHQQATEMAVAAIMVGGVSATLVALLMGWVLARAIAAPVSTMAKVMHGLASGNLDVDVAHQGRRDEVGDMAKAVMIFRDAALANQRLEQAAAEARDMAAEEQARHEASREAQAREQAGVVDALATGLDSLARGDLEFRLRTPFTVAYEKLRDDFNAAMERLQDTMQVIADNTRGIRSGGHEISQASEDLSRRTERQAASLEETAAALSEITDTVRRTAEGASEANRVVAEARRAAEGSAQIVGQAVEAMNAIETSSTEITQIIGVIDEIAFQTNLLALNAGVEAARAGESGRGFAVVAQEVRALAQRSADAAKDIRRLISTSTKHVGAGVSLVGETGQALTCIVEQVERINQVVDRIAASAKQQADSLHQVNTAVSDMDRATQQNAAMVEESTAATHRLSAETGELSRLIGQFKVGAIRDRMAA